MVSGCKVSHLKSKLIHNGRGNVVYQSLCTTRFKKGEMYKIPLVQNKTTRVEIVIN